MKRIDNQLQQALKRGELDSDPEYLSRLANRRMLRQLLIDLMDRFHVDALVYPFKSISAPLIGASDAGSDNPVSAITGLPAVVVPAGFNGDAMPIAIEFLGRPFSEAELIQVASAYERASQRRVAPETTPHLAGEVFSY